MDFPMPLIATKLAATVIAFGTTAVGLYNYFQWQWVRNVEVDIWPIGKLTIEPSQNVDAYYFGSDESYFNYYDYNYSDSISQNNDYQSGLSLPMERCFVTIFIMSFAGSVISLLVTSYNNARHWMPYGSEFVRYGDIGFHMLFSILLLIAAFLIILTPPPDTYQKSSITRGYLPFDDFYEEDSQNVEEQEDNRLLSMAFILTQSVLYGVILILLLRNSGPSSRSVSHFESGSFATENRTPLIV